jgi:hypothetical protein
MKLLNVIEAVLNCLHLAAELWEWLEKHLPVFGPSRCFWAESCRHSPGCMAMQSGKNYLPA